MIAWATGVNKKILRSGASWNMINAVLSDSTKSGKQKRRLYGSMRKRQFSVKMHFTTTEYDLFKTWYEGSCYYGLNSFGFPQIDSTGTAEKEYRFAAGSDPSFSNVGGDIIECTMTWEEV